ncbi:DUF4082 domain-containing protein [Salinibacterium sp. PAMC 21357]|uniref:DUF4082 domain-containing protein n=1 Tax=Salinibacterium sp. PAMC 21357 TaxID=1112215 RepID=UPI000287B0F6|nr:DUF4082 domain-containing protein [Salinibacterium sp. PAMC 21357]
MAVDADRSSVELGLKFSPENDGEVTALQYFQSRAASGVTSATLWTSSGKKLASITFPASTKEGWRTISLEDPVTLSSGSSYVVSYQASNGGYAVTEGDLSAKQSLNGFTLDREAGVYKYGTEGFPTTTFRGSNYLVDIVFESSTPATEVTVPDPGEVEIPAPAPTPTEPPTTPVTPAPVPVTPPVTTPVTPTSGSAGWTINANTVGLAPLGLTCSNLPAYTGNSSVPAGTTITGKRFTGGLDLSAGNITIENSCIQPTSAGRGMPVVATQNFNTFEIAPSKVTIRNSEFDGSKLSIQDAAWATAFIGVADLIGNYVHGFGSGIAIMNSGSTLNAQIERNYVTGLVAWGDPATTGNHSDAFTIRDFTDRSNANRQLNVINNRFNADSGSDTGALFIQTYSGSIDNVLIQGNLLEGNGYQLGLNEMNSSYSNLRSVDNRFSGTGFGATYVQRGSGWAEWSNNYIYKSSATDGKGAAVSKP